MSAAYRIPAATWSLGSGPVGVEHADGQQLGARSNARDSGTIIRDRRRDACYVGAVAILVLGAVLGARTLPFLTRAGAVGLDEVSIRVVNELRSEIGVIEVNSSIDHGDDRSRAIRYRPCLLRLYLREAPLLTKIRIARRSVDRLLHYGTEHEDQAGGEANQSSASCLSSRHYMPPIVRRVVVGSPRLLSWLGVFIQQSLLVVAWTRLGKSRYSPAPAGLS